MSKHTPTRRKGSTKTTTATKKTNPKASTTTASDTELEIERIANEEGDIGNAALNLYFTINYAPPFLYRAVLAALAQAATSLNLPPFTDEGYSVEQFTRLLNLFKATDEGFMLEDVSYHEGEFLARVLEYKKTPKAVRATIRVLMWGLCRNLADSFNPDNDPTPELIRALYVVLKSNNPDHVGGAFNIVFNSIERDAPDVMNHIAKHADLKGSAGNA